MSYDKTINNYVIKFKDEESYLEAKLENLKSFSDIPFIGFIQNKMYDKEKCEVESIEPVQFSDSGTFCINGGNGELSAVGVGNGGSFTFSTISDSSSNSYTYSDLVFGETIANNNVYTSGNLIVSGTISTNDGSFATGLDNGEDSIIIGDETRLDEGEEPDEPIDNRFDILDL